MTSANPRRGPRQARARATCDAIFEATARILETEGEGGFNTNRVAERAGISIGTLYQYFPNKQAILVAMARRETLAVRAVAGEADGDAERLALRAYIGILRDRPATRRAALKAILVAESDAALASEIHQTTRLLPIIPGATGLDAFVLSRAVVGVIRAAVLENSPHLHTAEFEDALIRLMDAYRAQQR